MQIHTHKSIYKLTIILINKIKQSIVKCVHTHTHTNANTLIRLCAYKHTIPIKNTHTQKPACTHVLDHQTPWWRICQKVEPPTKGPPDFFWNLSCYTFSEIFPVTPFLKPFLWVLLFLKPFLLHFFLKPCLLHFFSNLSSYTFSQTFPVTHFLKPFLLQFHVNEPLVDFL